jgi:predicted  nucleic acid-binding Zn-ribbon protein
MGDRLDERAERASRAAEVDEWERRMAANEQRVAELNAVVDGAEETETTLEAKKARLEQQLKTIIAPREAEALMHEIATVDGEIDVNETTELEALEEQSQLEAALADDRAAEQGLRDALAQADVALETAVAETGTSLEVLDRGRVEARDRVDPAVLKNYDRLRDQLGVAVARLIGNMCGGCHLDISAAEIDTVRASAAAGSGVADCPQCGRILVP